MVQLTATHYCTGDAYVRVYNFYIQSGSMGDGVGPTRCSSDSGECSAVLNWTSRFLKCGEKGSVPVGYSFDYSDPTGSYFYQSTFEASYAVNCE
jgi:hypothetical protein